MSITKPPLLLLLLIFVTIVGCGAQRPTITAVADETGLHLRLDPSAKLDRLELSLAELPVQTWTDLYFSSNHDLAIGLNPGVTYTLRATWQGQALPVVTVRTPEADEAPLRITLRRIGEETPLILLPESDATPTMVLPDGDNKLMLDVDFVAETPGMARLIYPTSVLPEPQGDRSQVREIPFEFKGQRYTETFPVRLRGKPQTLSLVVQYQTPDAPGLREWEWQIQLVPLDETQLSGLLSVSDIAIPAPAEGAPSPPIRDHEIRLPDTTWSTIESWFGIPPAQVHADVPYSLARVTLENRSEQSLPVILGLQVDDVASGVQVAAFRPSAWMAGGGPQSPAVVRHLTVPPGTSQVTLPIFVRPEVMPGTYTLSLNGTLLGSSTELFQNATPLRVIAPRSAVSLTFLATIILALMALIVVIVGWRPLIAQMSAGELISLTLLAALLAGGSFATGAMNVVLAAVLGPFNVFVGELASELWSAGIFTLALCLRPRPGTYMLLYLIQALVRGLMVGQLQVLDWLIAGSAIAIAESLLVVTGATLGTKVAAEKSLFGIRLVMALALAGATSTWVQLSLGMSLYRLHYADWYLLATVLITGFGFTALGIWLALPLGLRARRLHG